MPLGPAGTALDRGASLPYEDAKRAFAAQPSFAGGLGAATREMATGPVSYAMGATSNLVSPVTGAVGDFAKGLLGPSRSATADAGMPGVRPVMPSTPRPAPAGPVAMATATPSAALEGEVIPAGTAPAALATPTPFGQQQVPLINMNATNTSPYAGLLTTNLALRQAGAMQGSAQRDFANKMRARKENLTTRGLELDLADREGVEALRRLAVGGDEKALLKYRNIQAAKAGKSIDDSLNEKLLETYIRSTAEYNKDPSNMGKAAPSFTDFLGQLPREMFPNAAKYGTTLPAGMKRQVGTANGVPVYEDGSGKRFTAQ